MSDIVHPSWQDIHRDTRTLARIVGAKGPFAGIVAVSRGGLVPAAILARELDIRLVETICIASYQDETVQGPAQVLKPITGDGADLLVVDDLADSGATQRLIRAMLPLAHSATLYAKPDGRPFVDSVVAAIPQSTWVVFPWEAP